MLDGNHYMILALFLLVVVATNVPFGYLRKGYPKFSRPWARCLYIPIIINIVLRRSFGLALKVIPLVVGAVVLGQVLGGVCRRVRGAGSLQ